MAVRYLSAVPKVDCVASQQRRNISVLWDSLTIDIDRVLRTGGQIMPLSLEAYPVIKTRAWFIVVSTHVPFANVTCLIASVLQVLGKELGALGNGSVVIDHSMSERVQTCKD